MAIIELDPERRAESLIWDEAEKYKEELQFMSAREAHQKVLEVFGNAFSESQLVDMMMIFLTRDKYVGVSFFPLVEIDGKYCYEASVGFAHFKESDWHISMEKCFIWLQYYQGVRQRLAQVH
jgi:hypothetical protein